MTKNTITDFIERVREKTVEKHKNHNFKTSSEFDYLKQENSPVLVHCSAGIGRTGTYILIDQAMHKIQLALEGKIKLKTEEKKELVLQLAKDLREQRHMAIQTPDQYKYCYQIVLAYVEKLKDGCLIKFFETFAYFHAGKQLNSENMYMYVQILRSERVHFFRHIL